MTNAPATVMHTSVVSREIVSIALTVAALNALKVTTADIMNAYITVPNKENVRNFLTPNLAGIKVGRQYYL